MALDLTAAETRVLGALLEKQMTTPDVYPLTLNSLRLACNQSTNRHPVVSYDDQTITQTIHRLERRGFARLASGAGSRAAKYRHRLAEQLPMAPEEQAIMCVLMLRGPQTPGELKQRTERLHPFAELAEVEVTLEVLMDRELVRRYERRPGQKEDRFGELLTDQDVPSADSLVRVARSIGEGPEIAPRADDMGFERAGDSSHTRGASSAEDARGGLRALEQRVERLESEFAELREALTVTSENA